MALDIDAYMQRIAYRGQREPTLDVLRALHELHPRAIPFEGLDPWLGRPVRLDLASLQDKLLTQRRGGYCYEHNALFRAVLERIGFSVTGLAARVLYMEPPGGGRHPRTHMLLRVETRAGPYIADVGFGGLTLTAPLRLQPELEQSTPHEKSRLRQVGGEVGGEVVVEAAVGGVWRALYQFGSDIQIDADYEMASWYMSTHVRSPFTGRLMAARALPGRRLALADRRFTVHTLDGASEKRELIDVAEIKQVLQHEFGIGLPDDPRLDTKLAGLFDTRGSMSPVG